MRARVGRGRRSVSENLRTVGVAGGGTDRARASRKDKKKKREKERQRASELVVGVEGTSFAAR